MAQKFKNQIDAQEGIKITNELYDGSNAAGTSGQVLSSTGTGTQWIDSSSEAAQRTEILVKNVEGSSLVKGDPVYIVGSVGASERLEVGLCDSSDSSKMPCVGLLTQNLANNGEGTAIVTGKLKNLVTSPIDGVTPTENDTLFVKPGGSSGSALTTTKPTANNHLIQNVGQVGRVSTSSDGNIVVSAIMRTNDVPNQINRNVNFTDDSKLTFGDSTTPDLELYHDSTISENKLDGNLVFNGKLTGTRTTENLEVGGIRGTAKGSQTGDYIHLYERVHIGGPAGWGASTHGAPANGLGIWGSIDIGMNGTGVIQLDQTTIVDASRNLTNINNIDSNQGTADNGWLVDNGTTAGFFTTDASDVNFGASTAGKGLNLYTANAVALTINSSQNSTFNGTLTVEDQLFANAPGNNFHILTNESNNATVLRLDCTGDNSSLYLQGDHVYASGLLVIGNASSGATLYRGTYHDFQSGTVSISTINNATTNTDKFLVSDSGEIKYRTAAQLADDILSSADDEFVRYDATTQSISIGGQSLVRLKNTNTGTNGYAEIRLDNDNDDYVIIGSIGSGYPNASFAGQSYVYSNRTLALKSSTNVDIYAGGHGVSNKKILIESSQTTFQHNVRLSNGNYIYMDRGGSDYSNIIGSTNYPSKGYTSSSSQFWLLAQSKGGFHIVLNTDGSDGSSENAFDDFVIFQGSHDGTPRFRVSNVGNTTAAGSMTATAFLMSNGSFTNNSFWGPTITAGSGSYADFAILDSGTTRIMHVPTGTRNVIFESSVGIGEGNPASDLVVRADSAGGRGGEITILNYASNTVGNEAALNFGLEASTYAGDLGNAQIKARVNNSSNAASDMIFSTWNGSAFGERVRILSNGYFGVGTGSNIPSKLTVYEDADVWHARFGSSVGELRIGGQTGAGAVIQAYTPSTTVRDLYIQRDGGNVAIGSNYASEKLQVYGNILLANQNTNFIHGYSGSGLVLSHHNVGGSKAIVSGDATYPDNLFINSGGASSDWSNVTIYGNIGVNTTNPTTGTSGYSSHTPYIHVYDDTNGNLPTIHVSCHDYDQASLILSENSSGSARWGTRIYYEGSGDNFFNVETTDAGTISHGFTLDRYSRFGIGTKTPVSKLDVSGKVLVNGGTSTNNVQFYDGYTDSSSAYLHQASMTIRMDNSRTGGIDEPEAALMLHNNNGNNGTWVKLAMASKETASSGNTVSLAGIAAKKVAGIAGSWARGELHMWTKNYSSHVNAAFYGYDGEYTGNHYHYLLDGADIQKGINLRRDQRNHSGISFYSPTYYNWQIYMSPAGQTGCGANANLTAPSGLSSVTSWALRSRMEGVGTYGWLWETGGSGGGGATASAKMELGATTGTLRVTGDLVAYASDGRLKTNIVKIDNALEKVKQISGVEYDWVDNIEEEYDFHPNQKHEVGVIAQEVEKVLPEAVMTAPFNNPYTEKCGEDHNFLTVKYERIVPLLIESIKELTAKVEALENKQCKCNCK